MATKVHMEALSPTMEEGQIVKWRKAEGDAVTKGEVLAEVETDKAVMELTARGDGILRTILKREGETAPVGEAIAIIAAEGEDVSTTEPEAPPRPPRPDPPAPDPVRAEPPPAEAKQPEAPEPGPRQTPPEAPDRDAVRVKASPLARRLAQETGLDLATVRGSGPGGRVVKRDVETVGTPPTLPESIRSRTGDSEYEDVPLSQMRKTIARRLTESIGPVPHFFLTIEVDMTRAIEARARINAMLEEKGEKISLNDLVIRAVGAALLRHPAVNASWQGGHVRRFARAHVGVAVAVEDGLITPVVRDAHSKGVAEIGREVRELAVRAREKKLRPEEYTGATFSLSNLGMFGITEFTAVINPPEAGIVAVGAVQEIPVVVDGQVVVRPRMRLTMSCDHRVIDGATGARFLQTLKIMLEEPATILV